MVYEKYIRKNGKLYGPYTYHSKRVGGKVVSEYHGTKKPTKNHNFLWIAGVFIALILVGGFFFLNSQFTGKVGLDISSDLQIGETLEGVLSLSLKEGELIPASSKVIFDVGGNSYEYVLSDLVNSDTISGDFYAEGESISGNGVGYGIVGTKQVFPEVDFSLNILSESVGEEQEMEEVEVEEEEIEELEVEEVEEIEEEIVEEVEEEEVEEEPEEVVAPQTYTDSQHENLQAGPDESSEKIPTGGKEVIEEVPDTTITGNIIGGFFKGTFNLFQTMTGKVSLKLKQEVSGSVSFGESFTYDLSEGESAEIKSDSVKLDGELLSDSEIDLDVMEGKLIVTTEYSIEEEGFGENYLGGVGETISIDLSQLNLELEGEEIQVRVIYNDIEFVSIATSLSGEEVEVPETPEEIETPEEVLEEEPEVPETSVNETETNEIIEDVTEVVEEQQPIITVEFLTDKEKAILLDRYGDASVEIIKAEKVREHIEVTFIIDSYEVKHSYSEDLSASELDEWIERDRIRLLKDIARELSKEISSSEAVSGIIGSYEI